MIEVLKYFIISTLYRSHWTGTLKNLHTYMGEAIFTLALPEIALFSHLDILILYIAP